MKQRSIILLSGILAAISFGASAQLMECDTISISTYIPSLDGNNVKDCNGECDKLSLGLSTCSKNEAYYICKQDLSDEGWIDTRIIKVNRTTGKAAQEKYLKKRISERETFITTKYENCRISSTKPKL